MADPNSAELEDEFEEMVGAAAGTVQQYQYSHRGSVPLWQCNRCVSSESRIMSVA